MAYQTMNPVRNFDRSYEFKYIMSAASAANGDSIIIPCDSAWTAFQLVCTGGAAAKIQGTMDTHDDVMTGTPSWYDIPSATSTGGSVYQNTPGVIYTAIRVVITTGAASQTAQLNILVRP